METAERKSNQPQLTSNIERKMLALIEAAEQKAEQTDETLDPKLYLQLADLYHFHKNYQGEIGILKRFSRLEKTDASELVDIYERIDRISNLASLSSVEKAVEQETSLELVADAEHEDIISISSAKKINHRVNQAKSPFHSQNIRVLVLSAAYTGITDHDEVAQVAFLLFEYQAERDKPGQIIETYWAERQTLIAVPNKVENQFNLGISSNEVKEFDSRKIINLFASADFVVSHNDAEVERKLLATLIPSIVGMHWYSSEKDIPWRAMGFETNRLTQLAKALGEKTPRTCMERAISIYHILQKEEPSSTHVYLERLYNMQPMKAFEWTPELEKQQKKLAKETTQSLGWVVGLVSILLLASAVVYYLIFWQDHPLW